MSAHEKKHAHTFHVCPYVYVYYIQMRVRERGSVARVYPPCTRWCTREGCSAVAARYRDPSIRVNGIESLFFFKGRANPRKEGIVSRFRITSLDNRRNTSPSDSRTDAKRAEFSLKGVNRVYTFFFTV